MEQTATRQTIDILNVVLTRRPLVIFHHRVVPSVRRDAQTPVNQPLPYVNTARCILELDAPDGSALSRAPRVTDKIMVWGQVSGSDR